ncbi:MAG TPA: PEP-CTERM sorting domain-containing protein [Verrucomicrobiae bacterium]|jgi:hypothetical protein|nr:PEP-CTERM sorting domain-containing protein [Verrucomicrobiae bacterium]
MRKLAAILCLSALTTGAFAQGLVNFLNNNSTLTSATINNQTATASGPVGSWYYGLLIGSGSNPDAFTFAGVYATNLATAGRFFGGTSVPVTAWVAGSTTNYAVAMWSSSLGATFQSSWLAGNFGGKTGNFGISPVATGISGGAGSPASPAYNLFGGTTGIQTGFNALAVGVPEPSSMALAGLGAAALLIFRRRK